MWTQFYLIIFLLHYLCRLHPVSGCRSSPCTDCERFQMRCGCKSPGHLPPVLPHQVQLCVEHGRPHASLGHFQLRSSYELPGWRKRRRRCSNKKSTQNLISFTFCAHFQVYNYIPGLYWIRLQIRIS